LICQLSPRDSILFNVVFQSRARLRIRSSFSRMQSKFTSMWLWGSAMNATLRAELESDSEWVLKRCWTATRIVSSNRSSWGFDLLLKNCENFFSISRTQLRIRRFRRNSNRTPTGLKQTPKRKLYNSCEQWRLRRADDISMARLTSAIGADGSTTRVRLSRADDISSGLRLGSVASRVESGSGRVRFGLNWIDPL